MRADKPKLNKKRRKVKSNLKEMCKKRIFFSLLTAQRSSKSSAILDKTFVDFFTL